MLSKTKATQRNITPNFVIMKRKNSSKNNFKQPSDQGSNSNRNQRSESKNSKCSFQTYERRALHLSKLKSSLANKNKGAESSEANKLIVNHTFDVRNSPADTKRTASNSAKKQKTGRENNFVGVIKKTSNDHSLSRKKNSASGKIVFRPHSRSNSKRDQDSLQKQEQRAKIMNVDLLANLTKNSQLPNYKLKLKKAEKETREKRREAPKTNILCLDIEIKGAQALNQYQIYGELGKGAYGTVRMGICKTSGEKVAIKFYPKKHLTQLNRLKNLEREINILTRLDHPVIAKLIEAIETATDMYLVLEYGGANSLYNYLLSKHQHRLKETQAKKFFHTIVQTIAYLHRSHIVHRDIKAQNILINRHKQLKLIDFGFSIHSIPPHKIDTFCGTPTYMAPEIVSKVDHVPVYTDMWSLGILYYVMLQGNYPFRSRNEEDLFQRIRRGKFEYIYNDITGESKRLIEQLLQVNPLDRLTVQDILSPKWDEFFADAYLEETKE